MLFIKKLMPKFLFSIFITLPAAAFAQDKAATAKNVESASNYLQILMIIVAAVLVFVIWGMGQVLVTMGKQAIDKSRQPVKIPAVIIMIFLSLCSLTTSAEDKASTDAVNIAANYGGMSSTSFWLLAAVIFTELLILIFMMFSIRRIQAELLPQVQNKKSPALKEWWNRLDKKLFTKAVSVEKEADILLDHDYDGIRELDNSLPPWWKYGFMITIAIAFIYLLNFHVLGYGKNPTQEYQEEMAKAKESKELYEAKNADKIDETNLKMPNAEELNAGKELFTSICWTCHGKAGEGGAGPNLTDNYWLHKGSLTDVYLSIKHGYPEKGMQAWEKNYSPKQINNLAGYIKTLRGTNPANAKAPEGDIYTDSGATDSITVKQNKNEKPDSQMVKANSNSVEKK